MRLTKYFTQIVLLATTFCLLPGCAKFEFDEIEPTTNTHAPAANTTINELKSLYNNELMLITDSSISQRDTIVIEGVVTSDDREGNFYKSLFIEDSTGAIELKLNRNGLYNEYKRGQKIRVLCNGTYLGDYGDQLQLGSIYNNSGVWELGGLEGDVMIMQHVFKTADKPLEMSPLQMNEAELNPKNIGRLVIFDDIEIADTLSSITKKTYTYADAENDLTVNLGLIAKNKKYNKLVLRTSGYAKFAGTTIATGSGSITGILTYYKGTFQLIARDLDDIKLNEPRFQP